MKKNFKIPSDIDFIRIIWCDNANIIRAKAIYSNNDKNTDYYVGISESQQGQYHPGEPWLKKADSAQ